MECQLILSVQRKAFSYPDIAVLDSILSTWSFHAYPLEHGRTPQPVQHERLSLKHYSISRNLTCICLICTEYPCYESWKANHGSIG